MDSGVEPTELFKNLYVIIQVTLIKIMKNIN